MGSLSSSLNIPLRSSDAQEKVFSTDTAINKKGTLSGSPISITASVSISQKEFDNATDFSAIADSASSLKAVGGVIRFDALKTKQHASANKASLKATNFEGSAKNASTEESQELFNTASLMHREAAVCYTTSAESSGTEKGANFHNAAEDFEEAGVFYGEAALTIEDKKLKQLSKESLVRAYKNYGNAFKESAEANAVGDESKVQEINNRLPALMEEIKNAAD